MAPPEIVDTHEEAAGLELAPLLIRSPVQAFLDEHGIGSGPIEAERVGEGHSNITYLVRREGAEVVLRRPPRPPLPPSAHDVLREARLLSAVGDAAVRTPAVLCTCADESLIGVPFYVMEKVEGIVITEQIPNQLDSPDQRALIAEELIDALVEVHAVDWRACGLEGFGKATGYLERQLRRFNGLWEHNKTRELAPVQEVADWLATNRPEQPEATIVHGDFRLGNTMFGLGLPARLVAIFDWELATIGDPLADLGYLTITWSEPGDEETMGTMFSQLGGVTRGEGFPDRDGLIALYAERSGRSVSDLRWYQALALWKAAVFMEGNYKRSLAGTTDDPFLAMLDGAVPALADAALSITRRPLRES
ncbi:MAG: phosphotransferase family protein [Thermoleophilaceae bacterium]|nr:phosphotransferase family protein [Thermoleophilaceae bacterium]